MSEQNENDLISQRRQALQALREFGNPFVNDFRRDALAGDLNRLYGEKTKEELSAEKIRVAIAGRIMSRRIMGKVSFAHIQDMSGKIQIYVRRDELSADIYDAGFKKWDIGDIVGVIGTVMKTSKGELSVYVDSVRLLTKSLRPLPEKFHGLTDQEMCYRQRYVDLIMNEDTRRTFRLRSQVIDFIRSYLQNKDFMEVETPMMHAIPGGAQARPFVTHHNALDMELFLRIAPELYLKRLVVGGFERVFEINRSFRNEGLSPRHNPEFTMLEFYQAYADHEDLMNLTEDMLRGMTKELFGSNVIEYQGKTCDFGKSFERMTVLDAILKFNTSVSAEDLNSMENIRNIAEGLNIPVDGISSLGKLQLEIFESTAESNLIEPTFITHYPTEVSPLTRRNDQDPFVADRFELIVGGQEIANGFSELNDPEDQAERFQKQVENKKAGDQEAMYFDADYITALEYGMPPTAGEGIGIDRLVMLFTNAPSIRNVILFPHMRPKN